MNRMKRMSRVSLANIWKMWAIHRRACDTEAYLCSSVGSRGDPASKMERSVGGERACEALVELMLLGQVNRGWPERLDTIADEASTSCEVKSRRVRCKRLGPTRFLAR
jgi:hypothetical protein